MYAAELIKVFLVRITTSFSIGIFDLLLIAVHFIDLLRSRRLFRFLVLPYAYKAWESQRQTFLWICLQVNKISVKSAAE